ncbi:MAG TPA: hypothetical protein VNL18_00265, partial [Gemmatimonadales bacterium]|nr:hypothetical protein [Gemmatimonadales bacterium]
ALAFLRQQAPYENAVRPDLILLGLRLRGKGGLEVLEDIKADDASKDIPVVVLTDTLSEALVLRNHGLRGAGFAPKSGELIHFLGHLRAELDNIPAVRRTTARDPAADNPRTEP